MQGLFAEGAKDAYRLDNAWEQSRLVVGWKGKVSVNVIPFLCYKPPEQVNRGSELH